MIKSIMTMIWKAKPTLIEVNQMNKETIHESLGIEFTQIGDDFLDAKMPVNQNTRNPIGILHGGASVVLAESVGSVASILVAGPQDKICFGVEINASHLQSIRSGFVIGRAKPIRLGQSLHVWDIEVSEADAHDHPTSKMICRSRITVMIRDKRAH